MRRLEFRVKVYFDANRLDHQQKKLFEFWPFCLQPGKLFAIKVVLDFVNSAELSSAELDSNSR